VIWAIVTEVLLMAGAFTLTLMIVLLTMFYKLALLYIVSYNFSYIVIVGTKRPNY
jgi:hypothetical protein